MNLFSKLFRSRDKPKDYLSVHWPFLFGSTTAGRNVNERTSMQVTAVYACVRILSEAIASLPLNVYQYVADGSKEKLYSHPLYHLLHDEPNPEMTSFIFRETMMSHLLLWGNAYAQIIRNGKGEVVGLYPLLPNKMDVSRNKVGRLIYTYRRNSDEAGSKKRDEEVVLKREDVLHIPGLGFDGLIGYSPIAMAKNAIGIAIATEEYGATFFANGATPGGILEHPGVVKDGKLIINEEEAAVVRFIFEDYLSGKSAGQIAKRLEAKGVLTGAGMSHWRDTTIMKMWQNEKYIGDNLNQKTITVDTLNKIRKINKGDEDQYYIKNSHPAIIEREIFEMVREEMRRRSKMKKAGKRVYPSKYPLADVIVCGNCKNRFYRLTRYYPGKKKDYEWICKRRLYGKGNEKCDMRIVKEQLLQQYVIDTNMRIFYHKKVTWRKLSKFKLLVRAAI